MEKHFVMIDGLKLPVYSFNTIIIGSGAASLNAALQLHYRGVRNIAIITESWGAGTSNNAGSDKQTYYKLSLDPNTPDSIFDMASDLAAGGSMHGDIALCEAQHSLEAFFHLVKIGVPFPHNKYGAYPGYVTDHDPHGRATSAGPLTSSLMFSKLAQEIIEREILVFNQHEVFALLTRGMRNEKHVIGVLAFDRKGLENPYGLVAFNAVNTILGTGGPAELYLHSVYPHSQTGAHGMAFRAGAMAQNLTESQFGIASTKFRWNLSGSYQQVIPRYISTNNRGKEATEFLSEFFPDMASLCRATFLKGYQWPFEPAKIMNYGSSLIDLLVYRETVIKKRRVFIDYLHNPGNTGRLKGFSLKKLPREAAEYLGRSGAILPTPIERLAVMNAPALEIFRHHRIDLSQTPVEIAVCAQHNNGGLTGNIWWESNVHHLFPVGEVNGSHGVIRPGGSSLNAGQVGGIRAAMFIAARYKSDPPSVTRFITNTRENLQAELAQIHRIMRRKQCFSPDELMKQVKHHMSAQAGVVRQRKGMDHALGEAWKLYREASRRLCAPLPTDLPAAIKALNNCLAHAIYLEALHEYLEKGGKSRGSYLVLDPAGDKPVTALEDAWRFSLSQPSDFVSGKILQLWMEEGKVEKKWVDPHPIPLEEQWFENTWKEYRQNRIIQ
jgi:succinate dehydrogenase/fumarate reductase flavoprotein subunit